MKKIGIIGANSFLARAITNRLLANNGFSIHQYSRSPIHHTGIFQHEFYNIPDTDIRSKELLGFDVLIYCASAGLQPDHNDSVETINEVNFSEPERIIRFLSEKEYRGTLITFGSYFEIGISSLEEPYTEEKIIDHQNILPFPYPVSKVKLTKFISNIIREEKLPFRLVHLLLTNIYGFGENKKRLIPYVVQCIRQNTAIKLTSGDQKRQYTHVRDVAFFVNDLIQKEGVHGIYNITSPDIITIRELVRLIIETGKGTPPLVFNSIRKSDTLMNYLALDNTKAVKKLGWGTRITLESGIKEYFNLD